MIDPGEERASQNQPPSSDRPPGPPKRPPRDAAGQPRDAGETVYILDPMVVRDLAGVLHLKPFKVVADLMELKLFKSADDTVDFETASAVARKHGYRPERPPPGMLVL